MPMQERVKGTPCTAAAKRMRLFRERRRNGMRCVTVGLHDHEIDWLVQYGLLDPETRNDASAIADALHQYFDKTLSL